MWKIFIPRLTNKARNILATAIIVILAIAISTSVANGTGLLVVNKSSLAPADEFPVYLPVITNLPVKTPTQFGMETYKIDIEEIRAKAMNSSGYWMRMPVFSWAKIEPINLEPAVYHWETVDEAAIGEISVHGQGVIATIKYTPGWARKYPEYSCGPVAESALDEFAQFVEALVRRYSGYPYFIKVWELGNEPDIDPYQLGFAPYQNHIFGCWGDLNDDYYGGEYYAQVLESIYPAMKAADPEAQLLIGGMIVDCDPDNPPEGLDCKSSKFFEGILRYNNNTGAQYFDMVGFHGYAGYYDGIIVDEMWSKWEHRGGVVLGKADYLRQVMTSFGVDKPLMHTEGALSCPEWAGNDSCPPGPDFYEAQADYITWLFVRNLTVGISGTIWYLLEDTGWRDVGLLNIDYSPKPVYYAYQYITQKLDKVTYIGPLGQYPDLHAYVFVKNNNQIWVLWAPDQADHAIILPGNTTLVSDKYGNVLQTEGGPITVNSPIYVDIQP